jgi:hypothetical protein
MLCMHALLSHYEGRPPAFGTPKTFPFDPIVRTRAYAKHFAEYEHNDLFQRSVRTRRCLADVAGNVERRAARVICDAAGSSHITTAQHVNRVY